MKKFLLGIAVLFICNDIFATNIELVSKNKVDNSYLYKYKVNGPTEIKYHYLYDESGFNTEDGESGIALFGEFTQKNIVNFPQKTYFAFNSKDMKILDVKKYKISDHCYYIGKAIVEFKGFIELYKPINSGEYYSFANLSKVVSKSKPERVCQKDPL